MHAETYFQDVVKVARSINIAAAEQLASELSAVRERGWRHFPLGVKLPPRNDALRLFMADMGAAHSLRALVTGRWE